MTLASGRGKLWFLLRVFLWAGRWILASTLSFRVSGTLIHAWYIINSTLCLSDAAREVFHDSRWLRQARKPVQTACGRVARSARRCSPTPSRRYAKRVMEQWALHSQCTIAFCFHTLRLIVLFFSLLCRVPIFAFAVVFSMFPVFLA